MLPKQETTKYTAITNTLDHRLTARQCLLDALTVRCLANMLITRYLRGMLITECLPSMLAPTCRVLCDIYSVHYPLDIYLKYAISCPNSYSCVHIIFIVMREKCDTANIDNNTLVQYETPIRSNLSCRLKN